VHLTFDQLLALPMIERYVTLSCVSNEVGGNLIGNALWMGYPLKNLLMQAVRAAMPTWSCPAASTVSRRARAGRLDRRARCDAGDRDGRQVLPQEHGFPARLVVPGLYGYVSAPSGWSTSK